jgi:hypothetical protein
LYRLSHYALVLTLCAGAAHAAAARTARRASIDLTDQQRARPIPVELYFPPQQEFGSCIVRIAGSRHNDMYDGGSDARSRTE